MATANSKLPSPLRTDCDNSRRPGRALGLALSLFSLSLAVTTAHAQSSYERNSTGAQMSGRGPVSGGAAVSGSGPMSGGGPVSGTGPADPQRSLSGFEDQGVSGVRPGGNSGARGPDGRPVDPNKNWNHPDNIHNPKNWGNKNNQTQNDNRPAAAGAASASCSNCGTILQVKSIRVRPQPSWMQHRELEDPQIADSTNTELPNRGHGSSVGTTGTRSILNPQFGIAQFGKRVFEVTLMMDSGLTRKVQLDMMPAYNIGSEVRVVGNRLMPR